MFESNISLNFDERTFSEKCSDTFKMIGKDIYYGLNTFCKQINISEEYYDIYASLQKDQQQWKSNEGLILLIHGLFGDPSHWYHYVEELKKNSNCYLIKVPFVYKKGNCSLEDAVSSILDFTNQYIFDHPGNPICILSASNGARISNYIDIQLRNQEVDLFISTIAGAHLGSKKMNIINGIPVINSIFDENLRKELLYESEQAKIMLEELRKKVTLGSRKYYFFASKDDCIVTPFTSSLPVLDQQEKIYVIKGEGHGSIPYKVRKTQIQLCLKWLNKKKYTIL